MINITDFELRHFLSLKFNASRSRHRAFGVIDVDDVLFPNGITETHNIDDCVDSLGAMDFKSILKESWGRKKNHIVVEGEGGIGKTVLVFNIPDRFAPHTVPTVYVQLNELRIVNKEETIYDYLKGRVFSNSISMFNKFLELANKPWEEGPRILILMDGFNEVAQDKQEPIGEDIKRWAEDYPGVQVIITSRNDIHSLVPIREGYFRVKLQRLSREIIKHYLSDSIAIFPDTERQWEIISIPLMLSLFISTVSFLKKTDPINQQSFRESNSAGTIIWNYLQREIWRFRKDSDALVLCVYSNEFIAPFIAWKMYSRSVFVLEQQYFHSFIMDALSTISCLSTHQFPPHIQYVMCGKNEPRLTVERVFDYLIKESGLFIRNGKTFSLSHHLFRDALAALHLINSIYFDDRFPIAWKTLIHEDVIQFASELSSQAEVDILWERNRSLVGLHDIETKNMLELQIHNKEYNLSNLDFSRLDLTNISLYKYKSPQSHKLILPRDARKKRGLVLSTKSLLPLMHGGFILTISFTRDGQRCISISHDGKLCIWDLNTFECIQQVPIEHVSINNLFYSRNEITIDPEGRYCVVIDIINDGVLSLIDLKSVPIQRPLLYPSIQEKTLDRKLDHVAIDGGKCVLSSHEERLIIVWDLESPSNPIVIQNPTDTFGYISISQDGRWCIFAAHCGIVSVWDLTKNPVSQLPFKVDFTEFLKSSLIRGSVSSVAITPDCNKCILGFDSGEVVSWDFITNTPPTLLGAVLVSIDHIITTSDSKRCLTYSDEGIPDNKMDRQSVYVWNLEEESLDTLLVNFPGKTPPGLLSTHTVSFDGTKWVGGFTDGSLVFYSLASSSLLKIISGFHGDVKQLALIHDGERLVSLSFGGLTQIWDMQREQCINISAHLISCISFSPNGEKCVVNLAPQGKDHGILRLMDVQSKEIILEKKVDCLIFSISMLTGGEGCLCSTDQGISKWTFDDNRFSTLAEIPKNVLNPSSLAITADNQFYLCVNNYKLCIGDLRNSSSGFLHPVNDLDIKVSCIAASPTDKSICVTSSRDGMLRVWDIHKRVCIKEKDTFDRINKVVFFHDGMKCLCSGSNTIYIWDIAKNDLSVFAKCSSPARSFAFSQDDSIIVAGYDDNQIIIYEKGKEKAIKIIPLNLIGIDFSLSAINAGLKKTLWHNGAKI